MSSFLTRATPVLRRSLAGVAAPVAWNTVTRRMQSQSQHVVPAEPTSSALPEIVSGAPEALVTERTVRIYKPAKTSTQSGKHGSQLWVIDFDIIQDGDRWENALMGWASSADYMQSLRMKFTTKEEAVQFAENQGWTYAVQEPKKATFVKKAYADNYKYSAGPLRMIKTK